MNKILVVDDSVETTDLVKLMLESAGHSCTTANGGQEALELIRNNRFDLILLDGAMPEISGVDVLKELKQDGTLGNNRIVFFTASPTFTDLKMGDLKKEYGVLDTFRKPFTKKELVDLVTKYLVAH